MTGKQLRNSILQWAIQGKLVSQDPNDEPASVLLERIREEKARLVKEKIIKRDKNESIIYRGEDNSYYEKTIATGIVRCIDEEIPFEIPKGWEWCRLGSFVQVKGGKRMPAGTKLTTENTGQIYIRVTDMKGYSVRDNDIHYIPADIQHLIASYKVSSEDIYITVAGSIGRVGIIPSRFDGANLTENANKLTLYEGDKLYLMYILDSPFIQHQIHDITTKVGQPKLAIIRIQNLLVPICPKKEQKRISSRINEVLYIVRKYETYLAEFTQLNKTIGSLIKKSILQEAIQGKLVPQLKSEGTAEELLEEIRAEKKRLVKEGKLKKSVIANEGRIFRGDDNKYYLKSADKVRDIDDSLFNIPKSWRWMTLGELIVDSTGLSYKKEDLEDRSKPQTRVLRGGNIDDGCIVFKDDDVFISSKYVPKELNLRKGTFISPAVSSLEKIGKTAIIENNFTDVVVGGFVLILTPTFSDEMLIRYLYYFFQGAFYHNYCKTITKKSGQAFYNLSRQKLKQCPVPIPPKSEIPRILKHLETVLASIMSR